MANRSEIALRALQEATRVRRLLGYGLWNAIPIYDSAEKLGIEVRFVDIPTLEAIYAKGTPSTILISSLRPAGRQVFSCAHEIGHHVFQHGNSLYEIQDKNYDLSSKPDEFLVQVFAGFLLMPKSAVESAFAKRGWDIKASTPPQIYEIACWFGVGYETLIDHMQYTLKILQSDYAKTLKAANLPNIRSVLVGEEVRSNLIVVTSHWLDRAVELQIGDLAIFPRGVVQDGNRMQFIQTCRTGDLFEAIKPGTGRFSDADIQWSTYVKIAKQRYVGRSIFRYLEDPDYD